MARSVNKGQSLSYALMVSCCVLLLLMMVLPSSAKQVSPASKLLDTKRKYSSEVQQSISDNKLIIEGLDLLLKSKNDDSGVLMNNIRDEIDRLKQANIQMESILFTLNLHVDGLQLLCGNDSSLSLTASSSTASLTIQSSSSASPSVQIGTLGFKGTPEVPSPKVESGVELKAIIIGEGLKSCKDYKIQLKEGATSGLYWIRPSNSMDKFVVHCEQSLNDGGWALVTTRSNGVANKVAQVVETTFNGDSLSDDKWKILKSTSSELMVTDNAQAYATAPLSALTDKTNCKPLPDKITAELLYHDETKGCDISGLDYCLLGSVKGNVMEIDRMCSRNPFTGKIVDGPKGKYAYLPKTNIYVR